MRFVVDAMLGTLAKWLRVLGHDVIYARGMDDTEIISLAAAEGRVIISRDAGLCARYADSLLLGSTDLEAQLKRVLSIWPADPKMLLTRCLECNSPLEPAGRIDAEGNVPEGVLARHDSFRRCPGCGRIYWPGSHYDNMLKRARELTGDPPGAPD